MRSESTQRLADSHQLVAFKAGLTPVQILGAQPRRPRDQGAKERARTKLQRYASCCKEVESRQRRRHLERKSVRLLGCAPTSSTRSEGSFQSMKRRLVQRVEAGWDDNAPSWSVIAHAESSTALIEYRNETMGFSGSTLVGPECIRRCTRVSMQQGS